MFAELVLDIYSLFLKGKPKAIYNTNGNRTTSINPSLWQWKRNGMLSKRTHEVERKIFYRTAKRPAATCIFRM